MRVLDGEQFLVRILLGESDRFHHMPLHRALRERLRREGFAGATVLHRTAGFGASSVIHTSSLIELSSDVPVFLHHDSCGTLRRLRAAVLFGNVRRCQ